MKWYSEKYTAPLSASAFEKGTYGQKVTLQNLIIRFSEISVRSWRHRGVGSGRSAHCSLTNAFVPFSTKNVTGRDTMKGKEDGFGILRNASASQLVSFSSEQGAAAWGDGPLSYRGKAGGVQAYLHEEKNTKWSRRHWYATSASGNVTVCPNFLPRLLENMTCFNLRVTHCIGFRRVLGLGQQYGGLQRDLWDSCSSQHVKGPGVAPGQNYRGFGIRIHHRLPGNHLAQME